MKLTPLEKEQKKKRDNLKILHNRITSAFSFKEIKTWSDVNKFTPVPHTHTGNIDFPQLKEFLEQQKQQLEKELNNDSVTQSKPINGHNEPSVPSAAPTSETVDLPKTEVNPGTSDNEVHLVVVDKQPAVAARAEPDGLKKDYGLHKSPNETVELFWFQKKAVKEAWDKITKEKKRAILVLSSTGTGKTFMAGALCRRLEDILFYEGKTFAPVPYLYVTRASIVEQTERVFQRCFKLFARELEILNIEQLRSRAGQMWVKEKMEIRSGIEHYWWEWKPHIYPIVIFWDECQALKNEGSIQHEIAAAYNDLDTEDTVQVFISATPFTRVCEAKCFAVATHKDISHLGFPAGTKLTNENWPSYAAAICGKGSKPDEYNEAAVERLMKDLDDYVVRVKGVRPQFDAINSVCMIDFKTKEERDYYNDSWNRYLKEKARLEAQALAEGKAPKAMGMMILVQFLKFRMAAEYCRRYHLAKAMWESVQAGNAAVCALNFKSTIISIVKILVNDYNIPRDKISLIWGGGQTALTKKQKNKQKILAVSEQLEAMGLSADEMLKDMDLDEVEDRIIEDLDPSLRLGPQSLLERQTEIDKFQSGKSLFCLYTFRAGGVGLSLHHSDESLPVDKRCRRKESGYVYEEDIPKIPIRPRNTFVAPTYSAIELVQGLGRAPRLTSLSNTPQTLIFYRGTIEQDVAAIVSMKLRCLSKVVRMRESWEDVIIGHRPPSDHMKQMPDDPEGDAGFMSEGESDDE